MQITRQTEYAIRTLLELAKAPFGQIMQNRTISERQDVPEVFLKKTIQLLARAGLVATRRGMQGGVRLSIPADQITFADAVRAIEGEVIINPCLSEGYFCKNKSACRAHTVWRRAQAALLAELEKETFADMIREEGDVGNKQEKPSSTGK